MEYNEYLVSLTRRRFISIMPFESYKNKKTGKIEQYHILANLDKGILVTTERYKKDVLSSRMYFEVSTRVKGNPIGGESANALIDLLEYDNNSYHDLEGKEVGRLFCCDVVKYGLEQILKKVNNSYLYLNNPWQFLNYDNLNLLKSSDSKRHRDKITLSKIKRFVPEAQIMIGHKI